MDGQQHTSSPIGAIPPATSPESTSTKHGKKLREGNWLGSGAGILSLDNQLTELLHCAWLLSLDTHMGVGLVALIVGPWVVRFDTWI